MTPATRGRLRATQAGITCLLVLVIVGFWVYVDLLHPAPFFTPKYDPEMPYLLNSLAIFKSRPYAYIDHPGTPLEVVGTLILGLIKVTQGLTSDELVQTVLADPGTFLRWAHGLLAVGSALTATLILWFGHPVRRWGDLLPATSAAVAFYAVHPSDAFETLSYWSHNSLNFPAGTLLLLFLLWRLRRQETAGW